MFSGPGWQMAPAMAAFVQRLRAAGLDIGSGEARDALHVLEILGVQPVARVQTALAAVLLRRAGDRATFDAVFQRFWIQPIADAAVELAPEDDTPTATTRRATGAGVRAAGATRAVRAHDSREQEARGAAARGPEPAADYAGLSAADRAATRVLARRAGQRLARARHRRLQTRGQQTIDWPATLRASLRCGGELSGLVQARAARRRLRLFVFADVSHSMRQYSALALAFVDGLARCFHGVDIVTFADRAAETGRAGHATGGGTRIGASLVETLARPGRVIDRHTIALIVSDGWDAGDDAVREAALGQLARRSGALYWLDPLAEHPDYFASAAGPQHQSPHVDRVVAARSLASLEAGIRRLPGFPGL